MFCVENFFSQELGGNWEHQQPAEGIQPLRGGDEATGVIHSQLHKLSSRLM